MQTGIFSINTNVKFCRAMCVHNWTSDFKRHTRDPFWKGYFKKIKPNKFICGTNINDLLLKGKTIPKVIKLRIFTIPTHWWLRLYSLNDQSKVIWFTCTPCTGGWLRAVQWLFHFSFLQGSEWAAMWEECAGWECFRQKYCIYCFHTASLAFNSITAITDCLKKLYFCQCWSRRRFCFLDVCKTSIYSLSVLTKGAPS